MEGRDGKRKDSHIVIWINITEGNKNRRDKCKHYLEKYDTILNDYKPKLVLLVVVIHTVINQSAITSDNK